MTPETVAVNYSKKIWWVCKKGHEWNVTPNSRNANKHNCPYCVGLYVTENDNLQVLYPDVAAQWDKYKNNGLFPKDVKPLSHRKVWWVCEKKHSWESAISARVSKFKKTGNVPSCPYCSGVRTNIANSLATLRPILLQYWDYDRNKILPTTVSPYSNKKYVWKCECKHTWDSSPALYKGCPYCSNRKVDKTNSLESLNSKIATEWDYKKNYPFTPSEVVPGSSKHVWWKCSICGHSWENIVRYRAQRGQGCPECAKMYGTSFAEQSIFFYLKKVFPKTINRYKYKCEKRTLK